MKPAEEITPRVLASGIDSLYLAIDVEWSDDTLFDHLARHKAEAQDQDQQQTVILEAQKGIGELPIYIQPFGVAGYEWLLTNNLLTLKIGNWLRPISRPSILVEIRSETLWRLGVVNTINALKCILEHYGASDIQIKPSRVDLCIDVLMDENCWNMNLIKFKVTRAHKSALFFDQNDLTGISIGKGKISARLYDKPLEIKQQSKKLWMYDIWGINEVPEGSKIIRTEFQVRRECLKDLNIETIDCLLQFGNNLWAYCSEKWLKFRTKPGSHHTQRKNLPFWDLVQSGFSGEQKAHPLIRAKALRSTKKQLSNQAYGLLTSMAAISAEENGYDDNYKPNFLDIVMDVLSSDEITSKHYKDFSQSVQEKRTKYGSINEKLEEKYAHRRALNLPSGKDYTLNRIGEKNA